MNNFDKKYNLRLDLQFRCENKLMNFSLNDKNTSDFFMRITSGGRLVDLENSIVTLVAIKPDGTTEAQFLEIQGSKVYCDLITAMKDQVGTYKAKALLINNNERIESDILEYSVTDDGIISQLNTEVSKDNKFELLTDILSRLSTIEVNETARQEAETGRVEAEKQREIIKQELINDIEKLVLDTNKKVADNLQENSNRVTKLIEDTETKIDNYKLEKDEAIQQDLQEYKEKTTQDINRYQSEKDTQINNNLNDYKINTTRDIESYKNAKDEELDNYKFDKDTEIDEYVESKNKAIDKYVLAKNKELDTYVSTKNDEIDKYKTDKDTLINNKVKEVDTVKNTMVNTVNAKITEVDNKKNELTATVNNKISEADERIQELQSFESQLQQIETVNTNQNDRLNKVEYVNKRQDVLMNGLFNENADGRLSIEGEGNDVKLEQSKDGLVEIESVKGNTFVNLAPKGVALCNDIKAYTHCYQDIDRIQHNDCIEFKTKSQGYLIAGYDNRDNNLLKLNTKYLLLADVEIVNISGNHLYFDLPGVVLNEKKLKSGRGFIGCTFTSRTDDLITGNYGWVSIRSAKSNEPVGNSFKVYSFKVVEISNEDYVKPIDDLITKYKDLSEGMKSTFEDGLVTDEDDPNFGKYKAEVKVVGKNKVDISMFTTGGWIWANPIPENDDLGASRCVTGYLKIKPNTYYTISKNNSDRWFSVLQYGHDKIRIPDNQVDTPHNSETFKTNSKAMYIRIMLQYPLPEAKRYYIQLEEGEVATPYEPYKESVATVYLDEPLYKDNELTVHDGKLGYWKKRERVILDGSKIVSTVWNEMPNSVGCLFGYDMIIPNPKPITSSEIEIICDKIPCTTYDNIYYNDAFGISGYVNGMYGFVARIPKSILNNKTTVEYFNELNPCVEYELAEPVFVPILKNTLQWILESYNSCSVHFETNVPISSSSFTYTGNVPSVYGMEKSILDIEDHNVDMVATTFDMDYRLLEVEWALEDAGITGINLASTFDLNRKGERTMALSRYEQAKIMILGGAYDKETLTRQLSKYLEKKLITKEEYDELISLMEAKELVVGE